MEDHALERYEKAIDDADRFLKLLHDFSSLGAAMRTVLTKVEFRYIVYNGL